MKSLTFSEIREIITTATDYRLWYEKDVGQTVHLSMPKLLEYLDNQYPLYSRVESLNKPALQELSALMWIGRGDSYLPSEWEEAVEYASNIHPGYIVDKYPLIEYLTNGLKKMGDYSEYASHLAQFATRQRDYKNLIEVADFTRELYDYLRKHPETLYQLPPYRFEELIADILKNSGFDTHLTQQTKDGGRDIIAFYSTPVAKLMTIVECKRYSQTRKIGVAPVERFLYVIDRKDEASMGMIVTTSSFTKGARDIEKARPYRLSLKDFDDIQDWLGT